MPDPDELALDEMTLRAALDLDQDERAYLTNLDLAGTWRSGAARSTDTAWGWLALLAVIAAFITWTVASQPLGDIFATANQVGLSTVVLTTTFGLLLGAVGSLIDISTTPALGLTTPLLAVLALALLFWPRITSAPRHLQGVLS